MRRLESHVEWGFKAHDVMRLMREARFCAQRTSPFADLRTMRHALSMGPRLRAAVSYSGIKEGAGYARPRGAGSLSTIGR